MLATYTEQFASAKNQTTTTKPFVSDKIIVSYWDERSVSYSCNVCEELAGVCYPEWERILQQRSASVRGKAQDLGRVPRMLDLGCGPGFFSIVFARMGCAVDAVDLSEGMLEKAHKNASDVGIVDSINFHTADICELPFEDNSFDVVTLRNVTWLMRDSIAAYAEWQRVLAPEGLLLVFDANWYHYLVNPIVDAQRISDQVSLETLNQDESGLATQEQERRCEEIALALPSTYLDRPSWDRAVLKDLGFSHVEVDEEAWLSLWTEGEQAFYGSSPLFMIEAIK